MKRIGCIVSVLVLMLAWGACADTVPAKIGRFPQEIAQKYTDAEGLPALDVKWVAIDASGTVRAMTSAGLARFAEGRWEVEEAAQAEKAMDKPEKVRQVAQMPGKPLAVARADGLFLKDGKEPAKQVEIKDGQGRLWAVEDVRGVAYDSDGYLWVASLAGVARQTAEGWTFYTGKEGLPYNDFTCVAAGPDGVMWFGTHMGAIRFDGENWAYRQGKCWLPNDDIRSIAIDVQGNAWIATAGGVGYIGFKMMTLAEKAAYYEEEMETCIMRTPFGYTSEVGLPKAGVRENISYRDSDNDGLWTSMYGAGECFGYAATKDAQRKARAKKAFEALRFLQKVTQGGEHSPDKGFVARTIRSTEDADPNKGRFEQDQKKQATDDTLWKVYEPRWPKSADGKWYWKSDTSSDELDGHYFFYPAYYDLVADTPEEKERVREVVRDLTDHLIGHNFCLVDHDGRPTRWSIYNPEALNFDFNWWEERGLKSLSILSYLTVASHITGDDKYAKIADRLVKEHAYQTNAMIYKIHFGPGSGNQSDDEMAFMCYYNLVKYTKDEELREKILYSFYTAWTVEQPEMNPFFNFAYAAVGLETVCQNPWGSFQIPPWDGWLDDAMFTLKDFPLDRVSWGRLNQQRIDIIRLPRQQAGWPYEPPRTDRGYRVNGKVLPVSERYFHHWNTDPWRLDYGGNGHSMGSGTVFLLPYYMGLYHGFIEETE